MHPLQSPPVTADWVKRELLSSMSALTGIGWQAVCGDVDFETVKTRRTVITGTALDPDDCLQCFLKIR